ncbi:trypsin-like peptidase domain-containing protein [Thalassovita sp.]|uniref:trypsin-like peptidase domain-containing protein n=1 Tax=Thalassovita sp. TaxID=1979401 RepID=UPI0028828E9D|nr:trypsin-like peptidase domain-containing protein [Thalassovita sp.]MDF1803373.1 trypsin-like peptidase domain-containing protein [Thalassovita sp.]
MRQRFRPDSLPVFSARRPRHPVLRMIPMLALCLTLISAIADRAQAAQQGALERGLRATLVVYTDDGDERFLGSAVLWRDGRLAVTNAHVVKRNARVILRNQDGDTVVGKVILRDDKRDIAVIELPGAIWGKGLEPARALPSLGTEVYALGAPLQTESTVTRGIVSAAARQVLASVPVRYIQHDAAINPGSSGGPLLDAAGRVLGINARVADGSRLFVGISYAIPAALIDQAIAGELRPVQDLGLTLRPLDRRSALALGVSKGAGLLVDNVDPASLGARAGLKPGDILTELNGVQIATAEDLAFALESRKDDRVQLIVLRRGDVVRLTLNLRVQSVSIDDDGASRSIAIIRAYDLARLGLQLAQDGVTVEVISPVSPAFLAGMDVGDVIVSVNGQPATPELLKTLKISRPVLMLVRRPNGRTLHVTVDPWSNGARVRPVGGAANVLDPVVVIF